MTLIETVIKTINTHIDNPDVCKHGCWTLENVSSMALTFQKGICEKGGLEVFLKVLSVHLNNPDVSDGSCLAIRATLMSPETHAKYCTPEVIRAVEEYYEKYPFSAIVNMTVYSLKREEDSRIRDAVSRGVCTKEYFPKCSEDCQCNEDCCYCPKCCVQQRAFKCFTCNKNRPRLYCEVCWKKYHKGHKGIEAFCPAVCATAHFN